MVPPPRPQQWEVPDLDDAGYYQILQSLDPEGTRSLPESRFWKALSFLTADRHRDVFNFLSSRSGFVDKTQDDWQPSRYLGSGSFGCAGAWVKKDKQGATIDEIAVKELRNEKYVGRSERLRSELWDISNPHLFREAVIQKQLNLSNCESMLNPSHSHIVIEC